MLTHRNEMTLVEMKWNNVISWNKVLTHRNEMTLVEDVSIMK